MYELWLFHRLLGNKWEYQKDECVFFAERFLKIRIADLSVNSGSDIAAFGGGDGKRFAMKLGSPWIDDPIIEKIDFGSIQNFNDTASELWVRTVAILDFIVENPQPINAIGVDAVDMAVNDFIVADIDIGNDTAEL